MKKLLLASMLFIAMNVSAQVGMDTLLCNNFNTDPANYMQIAIPLGNVNDTVWYNWDLDGIPDGSPGGQRPLEWFWTTAYADLDTVGNPGVLGSSSWTNGSVPTENILITPAIYIGDTSAMLHWKSGVYQTPRYLDGYQVLISTGTNDLNQFTDTVFWASEYVSLDNSSAPNSYSSYTFWPAPTANPMAPFVHGMDGTYTWFDPASDSSRLAGLLHPLTVDLTPYNGQTIYIMFRHYCVDDNLLEIDDICVTGTNFTHVPELKAEVTVKACPNPASDELKIKFDLTSSGKTTVNVYDMTGQLMNSVDMGELHTGSHSLKLDVNDYARGVYHVQIISGNSTGTLRFVKQ